MIKKNIVPKQNSGTKWQILFYYTLASAYLSTNFHYNNWVTIVCERVPPAALLPAQNLSFNVSKLILIFFFAKACGVTTGSVCHSWVLDFSQQFVFKFYCTCESFLCPFNRYVVSLCAPEKKIPKTHSTLPNLHSEFWSWACSVDLTGIATEALTLNK